MAFMKKFAGLHLRDQGGSCSQFEKDFLTAHNTYRKQHGAPALQLSRDLCKSAQKWADHLLSIQTLQHSGTDQGENLFYKYSSSAREMPGQEPVDSWYNEVKNYNFSRPGFHGNTGHFTQVVWKDSREVGVGMATDGKGLFFVVGQYNPAGNITNAGYFEKNVSPSGMGVSVQSGNSDRWRPTDDRSQVPEPSKSRNAPGGISMDYSRRGGDWSQFEKDFLTAHNTYRKQHGAPALELSRNLCQSAQKWADHLLSIQTLQHSGTDHGENLFYKYSSSAREMPGRDPVESWYNEIKNYNFGRPGFRSNTGHFTQVVWKDSREVGVGMATDGKGLFFVVGQYNPAGNITNAGYFEKNVSPSGMGVSVDSGNSDRWRPTDDRSQVPEPSKSRTEPVKISVDYDRHDGMTSQFEQEVLETHNTYRRQHGAPPLRLSRELCQASQKWASHLLSLRALQHSNTAHGENIWYKWNSSLRDISGKDVVDTWYSEIKDYNFSEPGFQNNTGHFTQVVWKDSKEVGIAKTVDGKGLVIVVAQYSPAGNITNPGYFQKNVLPKGTPVTAGASPSNHGTIGPYPGSGIKDTKSSTAGSDDFVQDFLKANNAYRLRHGAKPLTLNQKMSHEAQKWAEHLLQLKTLKHSDTSYGENIWAKTGGPSTTLNGQEVADTWYKEETNYDFSNPDYQANTGHFTQMVWRSSKEVGVGKATNGKGMFIVVALYNPTGNITNPGYYSSNVLPAGSKVTESDQDDSPGKATAITASIAVPAREHQAFMKELLSEHNKYRSLHGAHALLLAPNLAQEAQKWAEHLVSIRVLSNSDTQHGENLWYRWGTDISLPKGKEVAESWYNEIQKYNFSKPGFQKGAGNFTQMIWKSSAQVGFGLATDNKGMYIVVGFYNPAGNIANKGYFEENVLPKKK
ncbi:uncharacterized protein LOC115097266 isoform X2 [Rhinatrema bivittatum]|uniref:uncharacterized protein LOC115097266 isoform X2 n=1 Tax=Rhinatrema bivittatum TaxID=194408 RepID=UPI00112DCD2B|nr:uncharacterized protein LOC115097266 isoform X2 [Rhinatrema bivittatum]